MQWTTILDSNQSNTRIPIRRFSVQEYHRLAEVGILNDDDRVELLEGLISPKMVHSPIHDATVSIVECLLRMFLATGYLLRIQSAITLQTSEPEPDLALVKGPPTRYLGNHPMGSDIAHVVEVSESTLSRDRMKVATYASAGIPVYWIINLKHLCVDVFEKPVAGGYQQERRFLVDDVLQLPEGYLIGTSIRVAECLPPIVNV